MVAMRFVVYVYAPGYFPTRWIHRLASRADADAYRDGVVGIFKEKGYAIEAAVRGPGDPMPEFWLTEEQLQTGDTSPPSR
jgi:hypothetical protein